MKKFTIVAGVNGAGKSTLYQLDPDLKCENRVNADEILKEFGGDWKVLPLCNLVAVYDNTEDFRRFAIYKDGSLVRLSHKVPKWFNNKE